MPCPDLELLRGKPLGQEIVAEKFLEWLCFPDYRAVFFPDASTGNEHQSGSERIFLIRSSRLGNLA